MGRGPPTKGLTHNTAARRGAVFVKMLPENNFLMGLRPGSDSRLPGFPYKARDFRMMFPETVRAY